METRTGGRLFVSAALVAALVLPGSAASAEEEGHAGGGGGGHSTGSTGSLYSDLVIAYRHADGSPILKEYYTEATAEDPATSHFCVQPASFVRAPGVPVTTDPLTAKDVYVLPLQGEWIANPPDPLPVDEIEPCDVQPAYAMFVSEAELERLNLGRTSEDVLQRKLADVKTKFDLADTLSLDPAGRIAADGAALDASPEYAAMYASLMKTGTIPGLEETGVVSQAAHGEMYAGFRYDAYDLAAVALGAAASKTVPITVDTVQYYNRVVGFTAAAPGWAGLTFLQSADPDGGTHDATIPRDVLPGSEQFVNYSGFTYSREDTFPGSITYLDVPTLTWHVESILETVAFTEVTTPGLGSGTGTLTGLAAFAQMADDVRSVISYLHEHEVIPGFYMDPVGVDTTADQNNRLDDPVADLTVPAETVFENEGFDLSVALFNPKVGDPITSAQLRLTITPVSASGPLAEGDVTATSESSPVDLTLEGGALVGHLSLPDGVDPTATTGFGVTFGDGTAGSYTVKVELVDDHPAETLLAEDTAVLTVLDDVATVLWAGEVPTVATQGSQILLPLKVYAPADTSAQLGLTVSMDDPTTAGADPLAPGNIRVYGVRPDAMEAMLLTATNGVLEGTWTMPLIAGDNAVTWYLSVVEGAPVGQYTLGVTFPAGVDEADAVTIGVSAPVDHKAPNTPVINPPEVNGDRATITAKSPDRDVASYKFVLVKDFVHLEAVSSKDGTVTFDGLSPGSYKVNVTAVDNAGNVSDQSATTFVISSTSVPGGGGSVVTPTDPAEPGEGEGPGGPPDTFVAKGPQNDAFVLGHSVTYRLGSNGEDVQYRVMLNNRFDQDCESNVCVVDGLATGKNELRFAAQAAGQRDDTPVVRTLFVPRSAGALTTTDRWRVRENLRAFDGELARTDQKGQVIRTRAQDIKRIALVVTTGPGNGRVEVYLGQRLLTSSPIGLSSAANRHRVLVPVTTFRAAQSGSVRVRVVSRNRLVRIEGIGLVTR